MTSPRQRVETMPIARSANLATRSMAAPVDESAIFNPYLIGLAIIYVVWSWVHLPSSIWARSLLACYLIWRMKPDVIIPFVLTCAQLRIQIGGEVSFEDVQDIAMQMTGFEQYAFMIPCILYAIRTFFAALSARVVRRAEFPFWLYNLYLIGMLFVIAGAISAYGSTGWTAGVRDYCVVGLYFYGLLMPACSKRQLMQLATGFAILGLLTVLGKLLVDYHSRQLWVLLPIAGSFAPLLVLGRERLWRCCLAVVYSVLGLVFAVNATFTVVLLWSWNAIAGVCMGLARWQTFRWVMISGLTYSLVAITLGLFFFAAFTHDPSLDLYATIKSGQGTTYDRMTFKLRSDRGPIWWGAMVQLTENPTFCGTPSPVFRIRSLGKDAMWPYSTHSILLDPLLRLGLVAGSILLLVLFHVTTVARNAIAIERDVGVAVLGLAVISNIVLGGATLPYMLNERAAEHMYMVAGLLGVYGLRKGVARPATPQAGVPFVRHPHSLPAA
jgi:hypothetical protein